LDSLRRGRKEHIQAERNVAAAGLPAVGKGQGSPEFATFLTAHRLERHVAAEQKERELTLSAAIGYEGALRGGRGGASWRPTAFLAEFEAWKETGEPWLHSGTPLPRIGPYSLMTPEDVRDAVTSTSSYPEPTWRQPGFEPHPGPQLDLVEAITWTPTDFDDPEFMLETGLTNPAEETAEGDAAPEAALSYTPTRTFCKSIPVVVPASRQALDDVAVLEELITSRLVYMIKIRLLGQVIAGSGSLGAKNGNLCGIINTPNVLSVSKVTAGSPLQPQIDAIAAAIFAVRQATLSWYEPTDLVINPADAEELSQAKDTAGRYIFPPDEPLSPFGLRTTITSSASVGAPLIGDVAALQGYIRDDILADISDSHADFFTRYMIMLRAEGRFGFAVRQPLAWACIENFNA